MARNKRLSKVESKGITELLKSSDIEAIQLGLHLLKSYDKIINKEYREDLIIGLENISRILKVKQKFALPHHVGYSMGNQDPEFKIEKEVRKAICIDCGVIRIKNSIPFILFTSWG